MFQEHFVVIDMQTDLTDKKTRSLKWDGFQLTFALSKNMLFFFKKKEKKKMLGTLKDTIQFQYHLHAL